MDAFFTVLLAIAAFWLGACPFSLLIGRFFLSRDVRAYGDGNPGAANVFRAGGVIWGSVALLLDIAKAAPFIILAQSVAMLPDVSIVIVALSAMLGHAFSPFLHWRGGKALAVSLGAILALHLYDVAISLAVFLFISFLFIQNDSWIVMSGTTASFVYVVAFRGVSWELLFMVCLVILLAIKHMDDLVKLPVLQAKPAVWLRSKRSAK